jgi:uncharacterized integral membrane protein
MSAPEHPPDTATKHEPARRSKRERGRTVVIVALAILITVFAVLNVREVKVDWIFGSGKAPLIIVILVSLVIGILITYAAERRSSRRR